MQLLEMLACGSNTHVSEQDILTECGSLLGYMECMDEMMQNDILTESVVMEGIDIKAIFKKFIAFIKSIIGKAKQLIMKVVNFFKGKKGKLKKVSGDESGGNSQGGGDEKSSGSSSSSNANDSKKNDPNSGSNETKDKSPSDATSGTKGSSSQNSGESKSKPASSSGTAPAQIGMKSKDETIKELFDKYPYSGVWTGGIVAAINNLRSWADSVYSNTTEVTYDTVSYLSKLLKHGEKKGRTYKDAEDDFIDMLDQLEKKGDEYVLEKITGSESDNSNSWTSLKGKIKSVQDVKNVPVLVYNHCTKDNYQVTGKDKFDNLVDRYNLAVDKCEDFYDFVGAGMTRGRENLEKANKKCDEYMSMLDKFEGTDPEIMAKGLKATQNVNTIAVQCLTYMSTGLAAFQTKMESDLLNTRGYITAMNQRLKQVEG